MTGNFQHTLPSTHEKYTKLFFLLRQAYHLVLVLLYIFQAFRNWNYYLIYNVIDKKCKERDHKQMIFFKFMLMRLTRKNCCLLIVVKIIIIVAFVFLPIYTRVDFHSTKKIHSWLHLIKKGEIAQNILGIEYSISPRLE